MAVCALPTSFSFQIHACSSNLSCSAATRSSSYGLSSRIQSRTHFFRCTAAAPASSGTSDSRPLSASSSNRTSTEKAGKTEEEEEEMEMRSSKNPSVVGVEGQLVMRNNNTASSSACQACGKEEKVGGCNGEGRITGGLGAVPGFGWFPIKAYRPCPAFVQAGGKYRRQGQSLEEVAFGRAGKQDNLDISDRLRGDK